MLHAFWVAGGLDASLALASHTRDSWPRTTGSRTTAAIPTTSNGCGPRPLFSEQTPGLPSPRRP